MREDMSKVVVERPRWGHSLLILILRKKQLSQKELKAAKLKNDHPLAVKDELNQL